MSAESLRSEIYFFLCNVGQLCLSLMSFGNCCVRPAQLAYFASCPNRQTVLQIPKTLHQLLTTFESNLISSAYS